MKTSDAAAAAAARARAEAAKREAERRAAEAARAAAKKAAEAAAARQAAAQKKLPSLAEQKKSNAALSLKAGDRATASGVRQAFGKDEVSKGMGRALRQRAATALGSPTFGPPAPSAPAMRPLSVQSSAASSATALEHRVSKGVTASSTTTITNPQETQAKADAAEVQKAYDTELKATHGNEAFASRKAAEKMNDLIEDHPNDPAYASALVRNSASTLDKIATTAGKNANGDAYYKDGDDDEAIKDTMVLLSDVAESSGALGTFQIAEALAKKLPDRDELEAVDDGFYRAIDDGHSTALFGAVHQRMLAAGKEEGAKELIEKGGGFSFNPLDALGDLVGVVKDVAGDAIGVVGDAGSAIVGAAGDALEVVTDAGEFVVDTAKGTVNLAKNIADATLDEVKGAVQYAIEQGLELAADVRNLLREKALDVAGQAVGTIDDLEEGESVDLHADVDVSLGVSVGVNGSVNVTKTDKGYVVAGEVGADIGLATGGEAEAGLSGRVEMTYATAAEAKAAAQKLLLMGGAGVSPVLTPVLAPSPSEMSDMMQHVSAIELSGNAAAEIKGLPADDGLSGEVGLESSYRMEFENGKPVALVRTTSLDGELAASLPKEVTDALKASGLNLNVGAKFAGSIELETRIPISGDLGGKDLLAFIASPATATVAGEAESSISIKGSVDGSSTGGISAGPVDIGTTTTQGTEVSLTIGDIDASEVTSVFKNLIHGNFGSLFKGVDVTVEAGWEKWKEVETGFEADFTIAGQGIEASAGRTRHDTLEEHSTEVRVG